MSEPLSLQMVASKRLGGAERWFMRFVEALDLAGAPTEVAIRRGGGMDGHDFGSLAVHRLPYLTVWDPLSRHTVARLIRERAPAVVQTYMGRATRLVRLPRDGKGPVHLARLGGYYALHAYRHAHGWIGNTRALCDWMIAQGLPAERAREIVRHGDDAWTVPCEDPAALAGGILEVLRDPVLTADLARAGQARVAGEFSRDAITGQYLELYRGLARDP